MVSLLEADTQAMELPIRSRARHPLPAIGARILVIASANVQDHLDQSPAAWQLRAALREAVIDQERGIAVQLLTLSDDCLTDHEGHLYDPTGDELIDVRYEGQRLSVRIGDTSLLD